jgi:ring-1,2-phenylacetyl-CoA epoxidase subunit PaaD
MVSALEVASTVTDPELPMLTLADLGVLRDVQETSSGVVVTITPTYTGCPAMDAMRADLSVALHKAGYPQVDVWTVLAPAWTTDWISSAGRRKLAEAGIAPPDPVRRGGPIPLSLSAPVKRVPCPRCGSADTGLLSEFSATACRALRRCRACDEPFEHLKEI